MRKSQLVTDPKPAPAPPEPASGINVVILFEYFDVFFFIHVG